MFKMSSSAFLFCFPYVLESFDENQARATHLTPTAKTDLVFDRFLLSSVNMSLVDTLKVISNKHLLTFSQLDQMQWEWEQRE